MSNIVDEINNLIDSRIKIYEAISYVGGTASITDTFEELIDRIKNIPVAVIPESIAVIPDSISLEVDERKKLNIQVLPSNASKSVIWTSDSENITIEPAESGSCYVTAISPGSANATVKSSLDISVQDTCAITVLEPTVPVNVFVSEYISSISSNYPMQYVAETQGCDAAGMAGSANWFISITASHSANRRNKYGTFENLYNSDLSNGYCTNCDWGVVNSSWGYRMPESFIYDEKYIQINFNINIDKDFELHLYNMDHYLSGDYANYLADNLFNGFRIQVSTDGTNFHNANAHIVGSIDKSPSAENVYDVTNSENVTSIRIYGDTEENWCGTWFSLGYIELYTII